MKLFKKTAALLFCLALVFSVMAISASATAPTFTVTLAQATTDTHTNINGNDYVEYNQGDTAVYNIVLKADNQQVTALDFKLDTPEGLTLSSVTSTFATDSTVTANDNGVYSLTLSTTDAGSTVALTTNTDGTVVATVTYTVGSTVANSEKLTFAVTDIVIHVKNVVDETVDTANAFKTIEVDPQYTIYVFNPATNGQTGVIDDKAAPFASITDKTSADTAVAGDDGYGATYTYSIFDGISTIFTTPDQLDGYTFDATFHVYKPSTLTNDNWNVGVWANDDNVTQTYTIEGLSTPNTASTGRKWGNIILVADYTATTYTVTYVLQDTPSANAAVNGAANTFDNTSGTSLTYTIESVVAQSDTTEFGTATRDGYTFEGWTVGTLEAKNSANNATSDVTTNSYWNSFVANSTKFKVSGQTYDVKKAFGNVTLTATWKIIGKRAEVNYQYANSGDVLILFAVQDTVDNIARPTGTYKCGGEENVNKMFVLNDSTANSAQSDVASALVTAYVGMFAQDDGVQTTGWTIYGYIAAPGTTITFTSGNSDGNDSIVYNGDVNQNSNNAVNAGDYGIAYDLFSGWANYSYEALTVENRLRAHIDATALVRNAETNALQTVGNIGDINAIMLLAGNTIS